MGKTRAVKSTKSNSRSESLQQLAREQGVKRIDDLDELGALWPAEDDPQKFLEFILSERAARRRLGKR